ncbi:MAG: hypothetical protein CUN56_02895 [Phototrophicales bacterium]|nr:MAG: hypothetical protein CUN56_02895 [Phototrophicales bacterium]RMG70836.1 MAG: DUF4062 domain-containing protein [Chloroflexota bacterium]
MIVNIYISSTTQDLDVHRDAVRAALVSMDLNPTLGEGDLETRLQRIRTSDLFIGILAYRYGEIPAGHDRSIVEIEYETAVSHNIPRVMFMVDPHYEWDPMLVEWGTPSLFYNPQDELYRFKNVVRMHDEILTFTTPESLTLQIEALFLGKTRREIEQETHPTPTSKIDWFIGGVLFVLTIAFVLMVYGLLQVI